MLQLNGVRSVLWWDADTATQIARAGLPQTHGKVVDCVVCYEVCAAGGGGSTAGSVDGQGPAGVTKPIFGACWA